MHFHSTRKNRHLLCLCSDIIHAGTGIEHELDPFKLQQGAAFSVVGIHCARHRKMFDEESALVGSPIGKSTPSRLTVRLPRRLVQYAGDLSFSTTLCLATPRRLLRTYPVVKGTSRWRAMRRSDSLRKQFVFSLIYPSARGSRHSFDSNVHV
jgi:hypothetical protein